MPNTFRVFLVLMLVSPLTLTGCDNVRPWGHGQGRYSVGGLGVHVPLDRPHSTHDLSKDDARPGKVFVGQVISVPDGETIMASVDNQQVKVRLIGIEAPELDQSPWGGQAREALARLVQGKPVQLITDIAERDQDGRLLAYVFVGETFVNLELLRGGMAFIATVPPNIAHAEEYQEALKEAQGAGRGVWDGNHLLTVSPDCYRKQQKGQACGVGQSDGDSMRPNLLP